MHSMTPPDIALVSRVERTVRRNRLFRPGDTLVVALSGGADSTFLLDLLTRLPDYNLRLVAAHLNHCLRGAESDADEEFCRETASRHAVPFESRRIDVKMLASDNQLNLEDAGRRARIEFLDEIRGMYGAAAVVLAHHADDQAETVLMRLLRGSGMTGLSGMSYRNARGYVRPLLDISRSEIERYLRRCGLEWREDASNSDTAYLRNRIRHELLPLLEEYNPAIRMRLAATASVLGGDEALLNELTERTFAETCRIGEGRVVCGVGQLRALNPALRRRVLRHAFKQLAGTLEGVSLRHIDAICDLVDSARPNSRLPLPQGVAAVREYETLLLLPAGVDVGVHAGGAESGLLITEPGCYQLPSGGSLSVEISAAAVFPPDSGTAYFDLARTPFPWLVRTFRPGDRMTPFGMSGRKKVKDIFIDRKVPSSERRRIPLLWQGEDLLWVAGVCSSELCRLDSSSDATVRVIWRA
ncbi:MAG: tRNA lysidine(34) synthetase TilS [Desulfuromonadaceae bacterium]